MATRETDEWRKLYIYMILYILNVDCLCICNIIFLNYATKGYCPVHRNK